MKKQEVIDQILYKISHLHMIHRNNTGIHDVSFYQYCNDRSYSGVKFAHYVNVSKGWLEYEYKWWCLSKQEYSTLYKALSDNYSRIIFK